MMTFPTSRRIIYLALFSAALFPPPSSSQEKLQDTSNWARYVSKKEEFSVLLPETPAIAISSRQNKPNGDRYRVRSYGAYGNGIVYLVISQNNPRHAEKLDTFVTEFKDSLPYTRAKKSTLTFDRELQLDGFAGKRFRVTYYNNIEGVIDFYASKNHVYTVVAAGAEETNPLVQKFLQSFSLNETVFRDTVAKASTVTSNAQRTGDSDQLTEQVFTQKEVTRPAFAVSRPEPSYTEEARMNQLVGTVAFKAIFSSSGKVVNLEVVKGLKYGLTERAIDAASKLKFIPAVRDGKFVSQHIRLEYNFNLY